MDIKNSTNNVLSTPLKKLKDVEKELNATLYICKDEEKLSVALYIQQDDNNISWILTDCEYIPLQDKEEDQTKVRLYTVISVIPDNIVCSTTYKIRYIIDKDNKCGFFYYVDAIPQVLVVSGWALPPTDINYSYVDFIYVDTSTDTGSLYTWRVSKKGVGYLLEDPNIKINLLGNNNLITFEAYNLARMNIITVVNNNDGLIMCMSTPKIVKLLQQNYGCVFDQAYCESKEDISWNKYCIFDNYKKDGIIKNNLYCVISGDSTNSTDNQYCIIDNSPNSAGNKYCQITSSGNNTSNTLCCFFYGASFNKYNVLCRICDGSGYNENNILCNIDTNSNYCSVNRLCSISDSGDESNPIESCYACRISLSHGCSNDVLIYATDIKNSSNNTLCYMTSSSGSSNTMCLIRYGNKCENNVACYIMTSTDVNNNTLCFIKGDNNVNNVLTFIEGSKNEVNILCYINKAEITSYITSLNTQNVLSFICGSSNYKNNCCYIEGSNNSNMFFTRVENGSNNEVNNLCYIKGNKSRDNFLCKITGTAQSCKFCSADGTNITGSSFCFISGDNNADNHLCYIDGDNHKDNKLCYIRGNGVGKGDPDSNTCCLIIGDKNAFNYACSINGYSNKNNKFSLIDGAHNNNNNTFLYIYGVSDTDKEKFGYNNDNFLCFIKSKGYNTCSNNASNFYSFIQGDANTSNQFCYLKTNQSDANRYVFATDVQVSDSLYCYCRNNSTNKVLHSSFIHTTGNLNIDNSHFVYYVNGSGTVTNSSVVIAPYNCNNNTINTAYMIMINESSNNTVSGLNNSIRASSSNTVSGHNNTLLNTLNCNISGNSNNLYNVSNVTAGYNYSLNNFVAATQSEKTLILPEDWGDNFGAVCNNIFLNGDVIATDRKKAVVQKPEVSLNIISYEWNNIVWLFLQVGDETYIPCNIKWSSSDNDTLSVEDTTKLHGQITKTAEVTEDKTITITCECSIGTATMDYTIHPKTTEEKS